MSVAVFHPGTQHSWQTALALQQLEQLEWYATSIFHQPGRWPYRLERIAPEPLAARLRAEFGRFAHPGLDPALVRTGGLAEWFERIANRAGWRLLAQRIDAFGNRRFVAQIAAAISADKPFALWGYNGSSSRPFELAKLHGRTCILDRTIGDFRVFNAAMDGLQDRYGEWFLPSERGYSASHIAADQQEYELADAILVGSEAAAATIRQHAPGQAAKLRVLPYCYDERLFASQPAPQPLRPDEPLRLLFVGQLSPRKGVHHLLEAFAMLPPGAATLTMVGDLRVPRQVFARYADRITYIPQVARHQVPAIMAQHHLLVFPSYFEGSALTLLEALASGLGIIQTRASGNGAGPETGLVLDRIDTPSLHAALLQALDDRDLVNRWRAAAQTAAQGYTFARYRANIAALLAEMGLA
ncbi:glycosyltransferase family 4 protein [Novosphingobium ginsenosidimutans]|uniref:Glycosyltransferase family 4 protein n=1 Tax=Novosphingobium ginsenosidimutans TaxID=1176536 RepID=A0A5B8S3N1_9SPHN|nr:glycosyltransferase family 4 protein [Novosphingobium ginsenosidimutans]QEA16099.1 glycosyltransferase family 4 protein [Novosphingobium ginsenosidimutans]